MKAPGQEAIDAFVELEWACGLELCVCGGEVVRGGVSSAGQCRQGPGGHGQSPRSH